MKLANETNERKSGVLDANKDRYRALAEQVLDGILIADSQGRFQDANRAACEMFGYSRQELKALTIRDLLPPEEIQRLSGQFASLARGGFVRNEWHFKRKDGSLFTGELLGRELVDGSFQGVVRDVTERKHKEASRQYQATLEQQATLFDLAQNIIFIRDADGHILYWNKSAAERYGWSKEEALGKIVHELLRTEFPEPLEQIYETLRRTGYWEGQLGHACREGHRITVESRWAVQADSEGAGFRILEINNDITERKQLEQDRANEDKRKDEFLALLGHELRNPLAAIATALQVLKKERTAEERASLEELAGRQVAVMKRLLDDLLDLSRIRHGHLELKKERIDLTVFLKNAIEAMQPTIASRKQELLLGVPAKAVRFAADRIRLEQIVVNLLSNASKYTGPRGRIELSGANEGGEIVIRCKDNGLGIRVENQLRIFEPFVRDKKTEFGYEETSMGVGLTLARQLTELHGGTISVLSAGEGKGSEFTVRLPLTAAERRAREIEPISDVPSPLRYTVVIVEDNPIVARITRVALEKAGMKVHLFADGQSALASVADLEPDVFLLDIGLPGMSGYELAKRLRHLKNAREALFVAHSGFKPEEGLVAVFDYYFTKPLDINDLLSALARRKSMPLLREAGA